MLIDDRVRLQHKDGSLPWAAIVAGGTAWDDLLFRALWLGGWEVHVVERVDQVEIQRTDLGVLAPAGSTGTRQVWCLELPAVVLFSGSRSRSASPWICELGYEVGLLEILRTCEVLAASSLECVPALEAEAWIMP